METRCPTRSDRHDVSTSQSDEELHRRVLHGDSAAQTTVYNQYYEMVHRTCLSVTRDTHLGADVAQDVFIEFLQRPERLDLTQGTLAGYLRMMARRRAIDLVRSVARSRERDARSVETAPDAPTPHGSFLEAATRRAVRSAIMRLPQAQRGVIELAYYHEHTHCEVAEILALPEGTVKTRLRLAKRRLRADRSLWHLQAA